MFLVAGFMAQDLTKMQDIKYSEKSLWQQYYNYIQNQDIANAINLLNTNPNLKYKVFNAFNWNRLIETVNDGTSTTQPTTDSMLGQWNYDYERLQTASANFKYVGGWATGTQYNQNNLITYNGNSYFCIQSHTASTSNQPPNSTYWMLAIEALPSLGIQVSINEPITIRKGDIWFDIKGNYKHSIHLVLNYQNMMLVDANFEMILDFDSKLTVQECLNQIEIIGGTDGIDATGTCVDGLGHSGDISKLQYTSSTNVLKITFYGTLSWPLDSRPPTTQTINDVITETI